MKIIKIFLYLAIPCFLGLLALAPWINSPIYPDEIAMHIHLGRYFQDNGIISGLFQLCKSNYRSIVGLAIIPAAVISYFDQILSLTQFRYISIAIIISTVAIVSLMNFGKKNFTHLAILVSFIGVAGSSLVFARYEIFQLLNILICLIIYAIFINSAPIKIVKLFSIIFLILSLFLSIFSHIQGLLFLPLNIYCVYLILRKNDIFTLIILGLTFLLFLYFGISFNQFQCQEQPSIIRFVSNMTLRINDIFSINFYNSILTKLYLFTSSFNYSINYPINYLPGINSEEWFYPSILNKVITLLLIINLLLILLFFIFFFYSSIRFFRTKIFNNNYYDYLLTLFILIPILILFSFDSVLNFYRVIFLNFLFSVCSSIFLSRFKFHKAFKFLINIYILILVALVILSAFINYDYFSKKFLDHSTLNSPSISSFTNWSYLDERINRVAAKCGVDLTLGKIIVDDLTFSSLKIRTNIFPLTYIALQADISKISVDDALLELQPNYAIARCAYMEGTKIGYPETARDGEICCYNFISGN